MKQTPITIKRELARLRKYIDEIPGSSVETRVAWAVEAAIRWVTEDTVGWEKPLESALTTAAIIRMES